MSQKYIQYRATIESHTSLMCTSQQRRWPSSYIVLFTGCWSSSEKKDNYFCQYVALWCKNKDWEKWLVKTFMSCHKSQLDLALMICNLTMTWILWWPDFDLAWSALWLDLTCLKGWGWLGVYHYHSHPNSLTQFSMHDMIAKIKMIFHVALLCLIENVTDLTNSHSGQIFIAMLAVMTTSMSCLEPDSCPFGKGEDNSKL